MSTNLTAADYIESCLGAIKFGNTRTRRIFRHGCGGHGLSPGFECRAFVGAVIDSNDDFTVIHSLDERANVHCFTRSLTPSPPPNGAKVFVTPWYAKRLDGSNAHIDGISRLSVGGGPLSIDLGIPEQTPAKKLQAVRLVLDDMNSSRIFTSDLHRSLGYVFADSSAKDFSLVQIDAGGVISALYEDRLDGAHVGLAFSVDNHRFKGQCSLIRIDNGVSSSQHTLSSYHFRFQRDLGNERLDNMVTLARSQDAIADMVQAIICPPDWQNPKIEILEAAKPVPRKHIPKSKAPVPDSFWDGLRSPAFE